MKIKLFILLVAISFSAVTFAQEENTMYVIINGVKWAPCNVATSGTFVKKPEDAGRFYQWNCKTGFSNCGTSWKSDTWEKANDPSPSGWRLPTLEEFKTLLDTDKVSNEWTTENGMNGRKFTDKTTGSSIFLPATGYIFDGVVCDNGSVCLYWISKPDYFVYFSFGNDRNRLNHDLRRAASKLRLVAE